MTNLAVAALWGAAYLVALFAVYWVLSESLERHPTWSHIERTQNIAKLPAWKQVLEAALPGLPAFLLAWGMMTAGSATLLRVVPGLHDGALGVGFLLTIGLISYVSKVRDLATRCANTEHELAVAKLMEPLRNVWGEEWTQRFATLQGSLKASKDSGYVYSDALKKRDALEAAVARAEKEKFRGDKDLVTVPRTQVVTPPASTDEIMEEMAKLIGRRITEITVAGGGEFVMLRFTDHSCFVVGTECRFTGGTWAELFPDGKIFEEIGETVLSVSAKDECEAKRFNEDLRHVFIDLWTTASSGGAYHKPLWNRMDAMLTSLGMRG